MNFLHIKFGNPVDPAFLENMQVKADACDEHHLQRLPNEKTKK